MNLNIFDGMITASITPFFQGEIDFKSLKALIDRQIKSGINGIVIGGSTGEGSCLNEEQYFKLAEVASEYAANRINIFAGMTVVSTSEALIKLNKLSNFAINGIMCTAPHYIKPEQEGLFQYFKAIHAASNLPLMLYIHPGRTACDFSDDTIFRIMELERFVAIKDATLDLEKPLRILPKSDINMLTGNDSAVLSYYANGGCGCVSVISNIFPKLCKQIDDSWKNGEIKKALVIQRELAPLYSAIFAESNPIGIKYAAYKLGLCSEEILSPLTFASSAVRNGIDIELERLKVFEENV